MPAGFMRSPEAVLEVSAYHDAPPHCALAWPASATRIVAAAIVAAAVLMTIRKVSTHVEEHSEGPHSHVEATNEWRRFLVKCVLNLARRHTMEDRWKYFERNKISARHALLDGS
jgi:hypothetical protein